MVANRIESAGLRRRRMPLILLFLSIIANMAFVTTGVWYLWIKPELLLMRCRNNLSDISRNVEWDEIAPKSGERRFYSDNRKAIFSLTPRHMLRCPSCKAPYIYSPVAPNGERIEHDLSGNRPILWCPSPCHRGKRAFLTNSGAVYVEQDSNVSWYYQKMVEYLSPEERETENKYRKDNGMDLLD